MEIQNFFHDEVILLTPKQTHDSRGFFSETYNLGLFQRHGFLAMEANTEIAYKVCRYYSLEHDVSLLASSKELNLELPIPWETMHLSEKDQSGISILEI
jgi:dTDP-4-dehydrorhamnose 3,5-epimerase-like enzyme